MRRYIVNPPTVEPLTLTETKRWLRVDHGDDDALISGLIKAARERIEGRTGRAILAQTWRIVRRSAPGVTISWIRRSRIGADNWDQADVPLGEAREAYLIEILSGASLKRQYETAEPALVYPAADEITDFGAPQASLSLRIRQISESAGPGQACQRVVPVL